MADQFKIELVKLKGSTSWSDIYAIHMDKDNIYYAIEELDPDRCFVKVAKDGSIIYALRFVSAAGGGIVISGIASDPDGNAYLAMYDANAVTNTWENYSVVKINTSGEIVWKIGLCPIHCNKYDDNIGGLKYHPDGYLIFASSLMRSYITDQGSGGLAVIALELDNGNIRWCKTGHPGQRLGYFSRSTYNEEPPDIIIHENGDISVVSSFDSGISDFLSAVIMRFDKSGNSLFAIYNKFYSYWDTRYGYLSNNVAKSTFATVDGDGLILSSLRAVWNTNYQHLCLWKVDKDGNTTNAVLYSNPDICGLSTSLYYYYGGYEVVSTDNYIYIVVSMVRYGQNREPDNYRATYIIKLNKDDFSVVDSLIIKNLSYYYFSLAYETDSSIAIRFENHWSADDIVLIFNKNDEIDPFVTGFPDIQVEEAPGHPFYMSVPGSHGSILAMPDPWTNEYYDEYSYDESGLCPKLVPANQNIMVADHADPLVDITKIKRWIYFYQTAGTWNGADSIKWQYGGIEDIYGLESTTPYPTTDGVAMLFLGVPTSWYETTLPYWKWGTDVVGDMWNFGVISINTKFTLDFYFRPSAVTGMNVFLHNGMPPGLSSAGYENSGGWAITLTDNHLEFRIGSQNSGAIIRTVDQIPADVLCYAAIDVYDGEVYISVNGQRKAITYVSGSTIIGKNSDSVTDWGTAFFFDQRNLGVFKGRIAWVRCIDGDARNKQATVPVPGLFCPRKQISKTASNIPTPILITVPDKEILWSLILKQKFWTGFKGSREFEVES